MDPLSKSLKLIEGKFDTLGSRITSIGTAIGAVGGALLLKKALVDPITSAISAFTDMGGAIDDVSQRTGASVKAVSELAFSAKLSGSSIEVVEGAVKKMQVSLEKVGTSKADPFAAIGLSVERLKKLSPEDQFEVIGKAIAAIEDPAKRTQAAIAIFGKSGTSLIPLFNEISELREQANLLGVTFDQVDAGRAAELGDSFDRLKSAIGGIGNRIVSAIAEPITKVVNAIAYVVGAVSNWIKRNEELVRQIAYAAAAVAAIGTAAVGVSAAVIGVGATFAAIGTVIGTIATVATTAFGVVTTAVGAILSPIGIIGAAVVGLGGYFAYVALEATGSLTALGEMFTSLGGTATTAWSGIVNALSAGDLQLAGEIAFTALEVGWLKVTDTMSSVWTNVIEFFENAWLNAIQSIIEIGANIYFGTAKYFDLLSTALITAFDTAFVYISGAIDAIQNEISKAIIKAQEFFGYFSKDQSAQIQKSLDSELAKRADKRGGELGTRTTERDAGVQQRDTERQQTAKEFSKVVTEDIDRRRPQAPQENKGLTEAQQRLADLQTKLTTKASEAAAKAQESSKSKAAEDKVVLGQAAAESAVQFASAQSIGSFSGKAAASQGFVSVQDAQLQRLDSIAESSQATADALARMEDMDRE